MRQKQKALKEKEKRKMKKLPLLRRNLEIQEHAVEPSVNFTIKKIYSTFINLRVSKTKTKRNLDFLASVCILEVFLMLEKTIS